ncbi:MAG: RagB/SusD family nutrient uptake outer membrane protein [Candidatus Pseudobacter hemicellulosilyticus]|uniref:RagB/SusD family nutrient uptake outer membrane protein n=1 Tax=Candidatus Pseudobacter hemicellulosilyticus TaxID=3121375 RepID=A0AAJ6BJJ1_9BACT|nr:MAG: RagB/SusD family nutrient uptake outer membrane protein [Pseudobacter sp.]
MKKHIILSLSIVTLLTHTACEKMLDVVPLAEFAPENVLTTEAGIKAVLYSGYAGMQNPTPSRNIINASEVTTDIGFNTGGAENLTMAQLINFTFDASLGLFNADVWSPNYRTVRDVNTILESIEAANISDDLKKRYTAECKFLRGYAYEMLYKWFGPVPLRISTQQPSDLARATDAEMRNQIEADLIAAIADLPDPGKEEAFGRANKGAAWALLAKYYLNTRQWEKANDACKAVMDYNYYSLFAEYQHMFEVANERSKEMILVQPARNEEGFGNWYSAGALPANFKSTPQIPAFTWVTGMANFATQYRIRTAFINTFDLARDKRAILLVRTYVNISGATVDLTTTADNVRSLKYWDNATLGNHSGNDIPVIRYADILLSKAEAMNEISGPTQDALDLINQVRERANLDDLTLADATSKDLLRDLILRERGWEFYSEGKRREDLLRQGKFISGAKARGIAAVADKHVVYPIPQAEIDANKACIQTDGY